VQAGATLPETRETLEANKVRLWLAQADLASAATWGLDRQRPGTAGTSFEREPGDIALARVLVAQGAHRDAHVLLDALEGSAAAGGRRGRLLEILLLHARVWQLEGRHDEAGNVIDRSLQIGETSGWIRTYVDEGAWLAELFSQERNSGRAVPPASAAYVVQLREAILHDGNMAPTRMQR